MAEATAAYDGYIKPRLPSEPLLKPIKICGKEGPNPLKVINVLEELGLPYEGIPVPWADVKKPEYLVINPNGRLPAIHDSNTNITLWESGAIVEYLIEHYDMKHKLSFRPRTPESYHAQQWLYFQTTGQAPWNVMSEVNRVTGVLERHLAQQEQAYGGGSSGGGPWLVGNKLSYADLAFIPWQKLIGEVLQKDQYNEEDFPHVNEWLGKMDTRELVKKVFEKAHPPK
ncbi:MAG: hypothetical protein Q9201_000947 [Fulgogasparrea decipioides]